MDKSGNKESEKIIKEVKRFKQKRKTGRIIMFGSHVRGNYDEHGDADLILVSKRFRGKHFLKRSLGFYKVYKDLHLNCPVDFLCFTSEGFARMKKGVNIVSEALREGVEV